MAAEASSDQIYRLVSIALDASFYRAIYEDVAQAGIDPAYHYVSEGWREGRDPAPWFSTRAYQRGNPDLGSANPFHHYLIHGWREGREVEASEFGTPYLWRAADAGRTTAWTFEPGGGANPGSPYTPMVVQSPEEIRAAIDAEFDVAFYVAANPDIARAGRDPVEHYLTAGWREEGREPTRTFVSQDYLELNPDVAAAGVNPFVHYITAGRAEGRPARHDLGFRHQVISRLIPIAERWDHAAQRSDETARHSLADLRAALADRRAADGAFHLSVSHDNFLTNVGGVQLCLQREAAAIAAQGVDHLHLYPVTHWPTLRPADRPAPTGVLWNGRDLGAFPIEVILEALRDMPATAARRSFALHSLLGHAVDEVLAILAATRLTKGFFWLHDFTSLCAGVHLMRDDVADCGAPPVGSPACGVCIYGPHRAAHIDAHLALFHALDLTVVAPSQSTYETWRPATAAPADQPFVIHPHARLIPRRGGAKVAATAGKPLTVAFLGMPAAHKGWPVFRDLSARFADDPRYHFVHLASSSVLGSLCEFHPVTVSAERPDAMRKALTALEVDVAVLWSLCRETFSFTAHEAAAAGVAVLTGPDSGNIAAFVAEGGHGRVLADEAALMALFDKGEALNLSRAARKPVSYDIALSALTVDLMAAR